MSKAILIGPHFYKPDLPVDAPVGVWEIDAHACSVFPGHTLPPPKPGLPMHVFCYSVSKYREERSKENIVMSAGFSRS